MTTVDRPIVVIGAGIGGLSAAIRLAAAGYPVTIFEQQATVGGKMNEFRADGFRWDTGPSVITMRRVLDDLFAAAGKRLEDYLTLLPIDPITRYFYPDGTVLDVTRDLPRMITQIAALHERDVEGYLSYLSYAARLYRVAGKTLFYDEPPTLSSLLRMPLLDAVRLADWRSMEGAVRRFVQSPLLRQLLGHFATAAGVSPHTAPAMLNRLAHIALNEGAWYPQGGVYNVARALERLARELGVRIMTGCTVQSITLRSGAVAGVTLEDGELVDARAVVANLDVATVVLKMLPAGTIPQAKMQRLMQHKPSTSGVVLLLGVEGKHPQLAQHNVFFSPDARHEFADIFERGVPPADPTISIAISSKRDPQDAPHGCENWFVMVNVPPLGQHFDWAAQGEQYRDHIIGKLASVGLDVRSHIRSSRLLTPLDFERLTGARHGALYGTGNNHLLGAFRRPPNRSADVSGLYFCGGTAHPGSGVPQVLLSGAITSRLVIEDIKGQG